MPGILCHSPSGFLDPWSSRTYYPMFCIFCMPVPDNDIHVQYLFLRPRTIGNRAAVCLRVWIIWAVRVVWPVDSPTATLIFSLLIAWSSLVLLDRGSFNRVLDWRETTFTDYPPVQVLLSQTTHDDLFTHTNGEANGLVRRDCIIPFLNQFISRNLLNLCKISCGCTELL
jgi:hypothetical protein